MDYCMIIMGKWDIMGNGSNINDAQGTDLLLSQDDEVKKVFESINKYI